MRRVRQGTFRHCVTLRCEGACAWCSNCRALEPPGGWDRAPDGSFGDDPRVVRLHGGDALRFGDLAGWVRAVRQNPRAWVDVEGPAVSLGGADADAVLARVLAAKVDGVVAVLPSTDEARLRALTGRDASVTRIFASLEALCDKGLAVIVALPVNAETAPSLGDTVRACAERLGDRVDVVLRRAHAARGDVRRLPLLGASPLWDELPALSAALAALPPTLPGGQRLHVDAEWGYAPCMLHPDARRADVTPARRDANREPQRPFGAVCDGCGWSRRCAWSAAHGAPPLDQITPLDEAEALALQELVDDPAASHTPHAPRARWSRRDRGLPEVRCVAPWTSLSATESILHPVPCALSWTVNAVDDEVAAAAMEVPVDAWRALQREGRQGLREVWHCTDNEAVSLDALWNNPLLRVMRRQMLDAPAPSRHCRAMCRTVMGVEDRGTELLSVPDGDLTAPVVANRAALLDELRAGRTVLTARPLDLVLGVAAHCNIECGFCVGPKGAYGELSDARRDEVLSWLPSLMSFTVSGPGEPLMSRNYLAILAEVATGRFPSLRVSLTTNGTLLTPAFLARHAAVGWSHVRVSLNAGSAETHARMTGKRLWERVTENLDALCALRDARPRPFEITLSCVLSDLVRGDLHRFAELVTRRRTHVVVEPMYGDLASLSPWTAPARLAPLADELHSVAEAYKLINPPLSKAFRAVEGFARRRLEGDDFAALDHH